MHPARISLVILLALAGGALSGLLMFDHHGVGSAEAAVSEICGPEETSGCEEVSQSRYSSIGGFSLGGVGLVYYGSLALLGALALVVNETVRNAAASLAFGVVAAAIVVDLGLFGLQAFVIGAFCALCLATYGVNIALLFVLMPWAPKLAVARTTFLRGEGSRALAVWALGSLVLLVSVVAVDRALASTAAQNPVDLLGGSTALAEKPPERREPSQPESEATAAPSSEPAVPAAALAANGEAESTDERQARIGALEAELERSRAKITELEATLDDPQKYQDYQMAKATAQFEQEEAHDLALEGIPFKGPETAPVKVVEFSDFLCPYCRNLAGAFANYLPQSGGKVAIYFKNYPLDQACNPALSRTVHDGACELALGAICATEQGKFWPYHDEVFAQPPHNPVNDDVVEIAIAAGLDPDAMRACLGSASAQQKLTAEIDEARRLEVNSTPTVFVNGKRLAQLTGFLAAIESELERLEP